ncbi:MAG: hypothetical protein B7X00_01695, partial [Legionella sp. 21-45-4]
MCQTAAFGQSGPLFVIEESGNPTAQPLNLTLCLNGNGPLSCQDYSTSKDTLTIKPTPPNRKYSSCGIKVNTPGFSLTHFGINCSMNQYGYCLFEAPTVFTVFTPGWDLGTQIESTHTLSAVSCADSSFCVAVDSAGNALRFNGAVWGDAVNINNGHSLQSISCPSSTFCMAVGRGASFYPDQALRYDGTTWQAQNLADATITLNSVSCPDSSFCMVVDSRGHAYRYSGTTDTWTTLDVDSSFNAQLLSVSCLSESFCLATDFQGRAWTYNGTIWSLPQQVSNQIPLNSISCASSSFCVATGNGDAYTYDGLSWDSGTMIDSTNTLNTISCPTASFCMAGDDNGLATSYSNGIWYPPVAVSTWFSS